MYPREPSFESHSTHATQDYDNVMARTPIGALKLETHRIRLLKSPLQSTSLFNHHPTNLPSPTDPPDSKVRPKQRTMWRCPGLADAASYVLCTRCVSYMRAATSQIRTQRRSSSRMALAVRPLPSRRAAGLAGGRKPCTRTHAHSPYMSRHMYPGNGRRRNGN